jgi:hypothetical protein
MTEQRPDELQLSGRLQIDTAIDALTLTDVNPDALNLLKRLRDLHDLTRTDISQNDLFLYVQNEHMKSDIIASALLSERNELLSSEARVAARGLLNVLGVKEP